ncbi:MAG: amidohydrolase [Sphaerochaeta sp.]
MKLRITNTLIVPMTQEGLTLIGDIGIDGNHIAFVGTSDSDFQADRVIDGSSFLAMPALVNAHTHLSMELMRNYKDSLPTLHSWLAEIFPIEDKLTEEDVYHASLLGVIELIQSGCTTFTDMYFHPQATAQAALQGGIRGSIGVTLFGALEENRKQFAERERMLAPYLERSNGRLTLNVAPHAIYTCTKETYQFAADWARKRGSVLHTHLSETRKEVEDCIAETGMTPPAYLASIGVLQDVKSMLAHCVHLSDEDVALLSSADATIVHNPSSNLKLSSGIAPIASYLDAGIPVALGTDGASSNNNLNMFEEMHIASLLQRVVDTRNQKLSPYQVVKMATSTGAQALGLGDTIGTLEPGKEADLVLIDLNKSHLTPLNDPFSALVYATQASDVDTVICQGKILMEHRKVLTIDEKQTILDVQKSWADILAR